MKCEQCGSTAVDHTEAQCKLNQMKNGLPGIEKFTPPIEIIPKKWDDDSRCLHKNCPGCKAGYCSGIHMISCPCPSCSPRMLCSVNTVMA